MTVGIIILLCFTAAAAPPQAPPAGGQRAVSGVILSPQNERGPGATVIARTGSGERQTTSDEEGAFRLCVPDGRLALRVEVKNASPLKQVIGPGEPAEGLQLRIAFTVPPIHESVVIVSSILDPRIERRNDAVYREGLFLRDDQLFHTLDAGINAGQHEGGGQGDGARVSELSAPRLPLPRRPSSLVPSGL